MSDKLFTGEHALVTGAASNIGRGVALALARDGARVTLTDIDRDRLAAAARDAGQLGAQVETVVADLATRDGWREVAGRIGAGPPEMFVHSACPRREETDTVPEVDEATFDAMIATNVRSGFLLAREVARAMAAAGVEGRMLFITSLHAETPRNLPHYSASKAGTTMVMKELARQFGPNGIRVNALAPGAVPGGGFATSSAAFQPERKIPLQRFGRPEDIAASAVAMLSNRFSPYVTGATLVVDGGLQLFNWIDMPGQNGP
jgi:3-oxoacyl-[acyl-carrier protein] reductase